MRGPGGITRGTVVLLVALLGAACGGDQGAGEAEAPEAAPGAASRPERASRAHLTPEYLAGTWCFAREDGEGERGVYVFDPDGSYRIGLFSAGSDGPHQLDSPRDLDTFWESYSGIAEIEPDRFVVLLSQSYRVVFRRAPC